MENKSTVIVIVLIATLISILLGQYGGGYLFFSLAKLDTNNLTPISLINYAMEYKNNPPVFKLVIIGFFVSFIISILPLAITLFAYFANKKVFAHGNARFANDFELTKSGLFPTAVEEKKQKTPAILIGKMATGRHKGKYLKYYGQQFIALAAPTRSGKGVGIMIPNLLTYQHSIAVLDIKLENFRFSAGFREKSGQKVFLFCPDGYAETEEDKERGVLRSHRYNPLYYIRRTQNDQGIFIYRGADILALAKIIYPTTGDGEKDTWPNLATALFTGLVSYMLDMEQLDKNYPVHLPHLYRLATPDGGLSKWMKDEISKNKAIDEVTGQSKNYLSQDCIAQFNAFIAGSEKTQSSIVATLLSPLQIFSTEITARATSGNDFDFRQVRKEKMSIYVGLEPAGLQKYGLLVNLFFSQLISENTRVLPEFDASLKYQVLLMLDEFTSMGRVEIIKQSVGYTAGYNVRYMFIFQSRSQMEEDKLYGVYGTETILDNCDVKLIYPPKDASKQEAKDLSDTLGSYTLKTTSKSKSNTGSSTSESELERKLMLPQEIVELGYKKIKGVPSKELVIAGGIRPFIAEKIIYFEIPTFNERKEYSVKNVPNIPVLDFTEQEVIEEKTNAYTPLLKMNN